VTNAATNTLSDQPSVSADASGGSAREHGNRQDRDVVCAPETVSLIAIGEPCIQTKLGDNDTLYLLMPRAFVDQRLLHGEDICARLVPRGMAWGGSPPIRWRRYSARRRT
jgi:hypothetical protein